MKNVKVKAISAMLAIGLLLQSICVSADLKFIENNEESKPAIDTVAELKKEIAEANTDKKITTKEKAELIQNTSKDVKEEYIAEEVERVFEGDWLKDNEVTEFTEDNFSKTVNCGKGTTVKIEFEDKEEIDEETENQNNGWLAQFENLFVTDVKAATTQSNTKYKKYGNRFAKFSYHIAIPVGYANIYVENHYKINDNGITERYLYHTVNSIAALTSVKCTFSKITDKYAQKAGYNTNANWIFSLSGSNYFFNIEQAFAQIKSTVTLLKLDKKNKQAKVKQSYWADCY